MGFTCRRFMSFYLSDLRFTVWNERTIHCLMFITQFCYDGNFSLNIEMVSSLSRTLYFLVRRKEPSKLCLKILGPDIQFQCLMKRDQFLCQRHHEMLVNAMLKWKYQIRSILNNIFQSDSILPLNGSSNLCISVICYSFICLDALGRLHVILEITVYPNVT